MSVLEKGPCPSDPGLGVLARGSIGRKLWRECSWCLVYFTASVTSFQPVGKGWEDFLICKDEMRNRCLFELLIGGWGNNEPYFERSLSLRRPCPFECSVFERVLCLAVERHWQ